MSKIPLTKEEQEISDLLVDAFNKFSQLEQSHPNHGKDFADGIHKCQSILIHRIVQRDYPGIFPTYT